MPCARLAWTTPWPSKPSSGGPAGQSTLDSNSVILADEVSMIGVRQQLALTRLARETGAQLVEIGDPRQCQAVETPAIDLLAKAIGDEAIPKLLTSIRQQTARGREVAAMFRDGRAVEAVAAMREDDQVHLVAGGPGTCHPAHDGAVAQADRRQRRQS